MGLEDKLCDAIIQLMLLGVNFVERNGKVHIAANKKVLGNKLFESVHFLKDHAEKVKCLLDLKITGSGVNGATLSQYDGRLLAKHLESLWKKVDSGDRDISFTNLTHGSARIPFEVSQREFFKAARSVVDRHPTLKLKFTAQENGSYRIGQSKLEEADIRFEEFVYHSHNDIRRRSSELIWEKLDNSKGMSRIFLLRHNSYSYIGVVLNHFVADLNSVSVVIGELIAECQGRKLAHSSKIYDLEIKFISSITDEVDYCTDQGFTLTRAYWRDQVAKALYRKDNTEILPKQGWVAKMDVCVTGSMFINFLKFMRIYGLTHLGLFLAIHASAQQRVFGLSTTIMLVSARNKGSYPGYVGKMDDIKPVNVNLVDFISCARDVAKHRIISQKIKFLPYETFPHLFYGGEARRMPFINLIVNDNVRNNADTINNRNENQSNRPIVNRTRYIGRLDERPDFEDYYLQVVFSKNEINFNVAFFEENVSLQEGEALVNEILQALERLVGGESAM